MVKLFERFNLDFNLETTESNTILHYAFSNTEISHKIVRYLLSKSSNLNIINKYHVYPCDCAILVNKINFEITKN